MEIIKSSDGATDKITEMSIFEGGDVWRRQIANAQTTEGEDFSRNKFMKAFEKNKKTAA